MPRLAALFALVLGILLGGTSVFFTVALSLGDYRMAFYFWCGASWGAWMLARQPPLNGRAYRG